MHQLENVLVPVMLGNSRQAPLLARRLWRKYRVVSHVFASRPFWLCHLLHYMRVVRLPDYLQGELLWYDLREFAEQYPDLLFCLIPCDDAAQHFCCAHAAEIEPYYMTVLPEQLSADTLPYLAKEELPI